MKLLISKNLPTEFWWIYNLFLVEWMRLHIYVCMEIIIMYIGPTVQEWGIQKNHAPPNCTLQKNYCALIHGLNFTLCIYFLQLGHVCIHGQLNVRMRCNQLTWFWKTKYSHVTELSNVIIHGRILSLITLKEN